MLIPCPAALPRELTDHLVAFAESWARHSARPQPSPAARMGWDAVIGEWTQASDLPLFVRKSSNNRGAEVRHASGRVLIPVDNSPAQWAFVRACDGSVPPLADIRAMLAADEIPVAMVLKSAEKAVALHRRTLGNGGTATAGWKLGHIKPVGLGAGDITKLSIGVLEAHFRALMSPSNMFVIPLPWAGIAEIPEVLAAIITVAEERA